MYQTQVFELDQLSNQINGLNRLFEDYWEDFVISPASKGFHGARKYGLFNHCQKVYQILKEFNGENLLNIPERTLLLTPYLHDICKVGLYKIDQNDVIYINNEHPVGHARLSLAIIKNYIELTDLEENMIRYHMGFYGTTEFSLKYGEYSLKELATAFNDPLVKLFYFCDDLEANIVRKF